MIEIEHALIRELNIKENHLLQVCIEKYPTPYNEDVDDRVIKAIENKKVK